jgi:shikimate kinase
MTIFVVGPSRGGKTTLLSKVSPEFATLRLLDLDAEEGGRSGGWEDRWRRNLECLRLAEANPRGVDSIVDVGAGSLQTPEGRRFFAERGRLAIAVVAPWAVVYSRHSAERRPEEFRETEYSDEREKVYRAAKFQVDSSGDIEESARKFRAAIQELLGARDLSARL